MCGLPNFPLLAVLAVGEETNHCKDSGRNSLTMSEETYLGFTGFSIASDIVNSRIMEDTPLDSSGGRDGQTA